MSRLSVMARAAAFSLLAAAIGCEAHAPEPPRSVETIASESEPNPAPEPLPSGFVVHEWGTFTSFQGSNGVELEGLHHEEEVWRPDNRLELAERIGANAVQPWDTLSLWHIMASARDLDDGVAILMASAIGSLVPVPGGLRAVPGQAPTGADVALWRKHLASYW